nr:putative reverse transcriptase domain-containing protein [Tanacetum cinerariifolium]
MLTGPFVLFRGSTSKDPGKVWHLDVGSSPHRAVVCSKGWVVRPLKRSPRHLLYNRWQRWLMLSSFPYFRPHNWSNTKLIGFILDDLHNNKEDGQHIDDGKKKKRKKKKYIFLCIAIYKLLMPLSAMLSERFVNYVVSDHKQLSDHQSEATRRMTFKRKEERNGTLCYWLMLGAATQRSKKKGMPLPLWRRADYVKAKRWVVKVMATTNGYMIDDTIYRLTKLLRVQLAFWNELNYLSDAFGYSMSHVLIITVFVDVFQRSLLNGRLARTISASSSSSIYWTKFDAMVSGWLYTNDVAASVEVIMETRDRNKSVVELTPSTRDPHDVETIERVQQQIQDLELQQLQPDSPAEKTRTEPNVWDDEPVDVNPFVRKNIGILGLKIEIPEFTGKVHLDDFIDWLTVLSSIYPIFVTGSGIKIDPLKVEAIISWPTPSTIHDIHSFHGLASYYRCFIRNFSFIIAPLIECMKGGQFTWTSEADTAFDILKAKALKFINGQHKPKPRHAKWVEFIQAFSFVIRHKVGLDNQVANALSRARLCIPLCSLREAIILEGYAGLPHTQRAKDSVMVVFHRFSKMAHFVPCSKTFDASQLASSHHPQTDGQTEVVSRSLGNLLRSLIRDNVSPFGLDLLHPVMDDS